MDGIIFNQICVLVCFTLVLEPSFGADSVKGRFGRVGLLLSNVFAE